MSKVVIQGHASGTGDFTIAAPNSNTDRTLTLPDEAGTVLTTSGVPSSAMPAGSVLQVTHNSTALARYQATVTAFTNTGFSVSITPKFANSKIRIDISATVYATGHYVYLDIYRDATTSLSGNATSGLTNSISYYTTYWQNASVFAFDSPNTTSAVTYNIFARTVSGQVIVGHDTSAVYPNSVYISATEIAQ